MAGQEALFLWCPLRGCLSHSPVKIRRFSTVLSNATKLLMELPIGKSCNFFFDDHIIVPCTIFFPWSWNSVWNPFDNLWRWSRLLIYMIYLVNRATFTKWDWERGTEGELMKDRTFSSLHPGTIYSLGQDGGQQCLPVKMLWQQFPGQLSVHSQCWANPTFFAVYTVFLTPCRTFPKDRRNALRIRICLEI